jgi:hypothetical protein
MPFPPLCKRTKTRFNRLHVTSPTLFLNRSHTRTCAHIHKHTCAPARILSLRHTQTYFGHTQIQTLKIMLPSIKSKTIGTSIRPTPIAMEVGTGTSCECDQPPLNISCLDVCACVCFCVSARVREQERELVFVHTCECACVRERERERERRERKRRNRTSGMGCSWR